MSEAFKRLISKLMKALPFINAVAIFDEKTDIIYSTENWDTKIDISGIVLSWSSVKAQPNIDSGEEYVIRLNTNDRLVVTSVRGKGHIIGVKDNEKRIIAFIEPDGIIPFAFREMGKLLSAINTGNPYYMPFTMELTEKSIEETEKTQIQTQREQISENIDTGLPFTARLMAYYRALEYKRENPLIIDPLAEGLAGDLSLYLEKHIRFSEMDYPIVRSYYIEEKLLAPWIKTNKKSQIILLGAGLDTRAYRFKLLQVNTHTIFEIDLPLINRYKEGILKNEKAYCKIVRIDTDLSKSDWSFHLIRSGYSKDIPTFWVLEGLAYYIEKESVISLLTRIKEISAKKSQIFVDIMQASRWLPFPYTSDIELMDPYSRHLKWGLNIKEVPAFFAKIGWRVNCSFADDYDQGRNVGQKGMIFVHGELERKENLI